MKKLSKGKSALKIFLIVVGIILLLWYLAPVPGGIINAGNGAGILFSAFLIVFGIFYNALPVGWTRAVIAVMLAVLFVVVTPLSFNMVKYANYKVDDGAQTVIVLGCKVYGSTPSRYLRNRCKKAAEYLEKNPDAVAVLSGGQGYDEDISEAQCMENVLVGLGIDKSRLFKEDKSTSTGENIAFSKAVIEENGLSKSVLVVTNEFHEYRAKLICDKNELDFHSSCSHSAFYTFLTYHTREMAALLKELVTK
ncbi:MAG: YdcF family protein [Eubacterium sp.]|nr:YdcF family protein [Eubacterium sp.]